NVPLRGVGKAAMAVRGDIRIVQGRNFELGRNEVIVGAGAAREDARLDLGKKIRVGQHQWEGGGVFSGGGGAAESEIWTDAAVLQLAYHRGDSFQSVYAKLTSPQAFQQFSNAVSTTPQLKVKAQRQGEFLEEQSSVVTGLIRGVGVLVA